MLGCNVVRRHKPPVLVREFCAEGNNSIINHEVYTELYKKLKWIYGFYYKAIKQQQQATSYNKSFKTIINLSIDKKLLSFNRLLI